MDREERIRVQIKRGMDAFQYDALVIIDAHGMYEAKSDTTVIASPMPCTFLTHATFGTNARGTVDLSGYDQIVSCVWAAIQLYDPVLNNFGRELQLVLRHAFKKFRRDIQGNADFKRDIGWHLSTGQSFYERRYGRFPGHPAINLFFSRPQFQWHPDSNKNPDIFDDIYEATVRAMPTRRGYGERTILRSEIVEYLYKQGFRSVFIVDDSCSNIDELPKRTPREIRAVKTKTRKEGTAFGGRRRKKNNTR